ncbi:MAG: protein-disulfide reductase DsbD family protein [Pseudoxanthomonas suwonensis]|nr:protein-disulfide reductase DsbD family protein [Pseudoxanthomonas suwonensis]
MNARRASRAAGLLWLLLAMALLPRWVLASDPTDLPPVDQVFVLSASAESRERIALQWRVAPGYYLYRHRTKAGSPDGSFADARLALPAGTPHRDEFFGDVEMYRERLVASVTGRPTRDRVRLKVEYQGCADIGICYPPQTRVLDVTLPVANGTATSAPGGLALGAPTSAGGVLRGMAPANAALPLPEERAFGFEAIVGDGNTLLLRFSSAPGYYVYRDRSRFVLEGASGIRAQAPRWPRGRLHQDEYFGEQMVYFDQVDVPLPLQRRTAEARTVTLAATFQGCQDNGICYPPMTRRVQVSLPEGSITAAAADADGTAEAPAPMAEPLAEAPPIAGVVDNDAASDRGPEGPGAGAAGLPIIANPPANAPIDAPATAGGAINDAISTGGRGLLLTLLTALLGGLILNLMPCVLPVLSLKAFSLANTAGEPQRARRGALVYTAGVLVSFAVLGALALALRQAGLLLGWGFQMQQPAVVGALALVMFGLGLGLSGLWHIGGGWTGLGDGLTRRGGDSGDFFTGVLAVVVATPCIAPLMGAALAYAFAGPAFAGMLVFLMLGLGLALPFLAIGFIPALATRLPRPGAWMASVKQLLAFPMYLTAAWLLWVLAKQRGADAVGLWALAAITLAFVLWALGQLRSHGRAMRWAFAALSVVALAMPLVRIHGLPLAGGGTITPAAPSLQVAAGQPVPYSADTLAALRAQGMPVFVNITADWCVTCKANERAVLARDGFRQSLQDAGAAYMVGDYTDADPAITAFLQEWKAVGIPLYVVYPAGGGAGQVLPTVLTPDIARDAVLAAKP